MAPPKIPFVMTIAGSDPSGGAGIQADLKTFSALGCYGTSVITALTAQNTTGVQSVHAPPPEFVEQQLKTVLDDAYMHAFKTGMLYDSANTHAVASIMKAYLDKVDKRRPPLVVDPVCVSTSGHTLLENAAVQVMIDELIPLSTIVTPNKSEAELLLSHVDKIALRTINSLSEAIVVARELSKALKVAILLKGGHLVVNKSDILQLLQSEGGRNVEWDRAYDDDMEILRTPDNLKGDRNGALVIDILVEPQSASAILFSRTRLDTESTHGTGCTLSAALACYLAKGYSLRKATELATTFTYTGIETAFSFGKGNGPLNHLHAITPRLVALPSIRDPYPFTRLLIQSNASVWKEYVEHTFVRQLGEGTLRRESFIHFIKQDYHYLKYYARAYGLLAAKAGTYATIASSARVIQNIINEITMHESYCASWGISDLELQRTPESAATTAYGAFLLDVGLHGDETTLIVALAACLLGYGEVGLWLVAESTRLQSWVKFEGNPYLKWIEDYSGDRYQAAVKAGLSMLESCVANDTPSEKRLGEWKAIWARCTKLEKEFWDMAMNLA